MSMLMKSDPFFDIDRPFKDILSRGNWLRPWSTVGSPEAYMPCDVFDTDQKIIMRFDIPGAKKEDIGVSIEGRTVSVRVESRREQNTKEMESGRCLQERYVGILNRTIDTGIMLDSEHADAQYENGVLTLSLPKAASESLKRLAIH